MYEKYNAVLRAKSGSSAMVAKHEDLCSDEDKNQINMYTTTIHCINSCILKLSKLTPVCKVWRGTTDASLPRSCFVADTFNIRDEA